MKKLDKIKNQIGEYFENIILKSDITSWVRKKETKTLWSNVTLKKDNYEITFCMNIDYIFVINIYDIGKNNSLFKSHTITLKKSFFYFSLKQIKLRRKYRQIKNYIKDKEEYDESMTIYNLLPIKEKRRQKLKSLK